MRVCALLALWAIAGCLPLPARAQTDATALALRNCVARLAPGTTPGLDSLLKTCPDLDADIPRGLEEQLGKDWRKRIAGQGLTDLAWLLSRYQGLPGSQAPDPAALAPIVEALRAPHQAPVTWWQKFKDWVRSLLQPHDSKPSSDWLERLVSGLRSVPHLFWKIVMYAALSTVLGLSGWIIWRELKFAGLFTRRVRTGIKAGSRRALESSDATLNLEQLERVASWERPVWLLRLLVRALLSSGRLVSAGALTHSELTRRGVFDDADQSQRFARIASLAEARQYGPQSDQARAQVEDLQLLREGRELYAQLSHRVAS